MLALPAALTMAANDRMHEADELAAAGRFREAVQHYQSLLDDPPPAWDEWMRTRLRLRLADSQLESGDFAAARATLEGCRDGPLELRAAARALWHRVVERELRAKRELANGLAMLRSDPDGVWGYRNIASGLAAQGRSSQAFAVLAEALGHPADAHALAMVEATAGISQPASAIALAQAWLQHSPQDMAMRAALLRLAVDHAPLPQALEIYAQHLALLSHAALPQASLARRLVNEGLPEAALRQYQPLLTDPVLGLDSHLAMAAIHARLDRPDQAVAMLRRAIETWPDHGPGIPGQRGADHSPYTALLQHVCRLRRLEQIEHDWPALDGPDGALIRRHLAQARRQATCATEPASHIASENPA